MKYFITLLLITFCLSAQAQRTKIDTIVAEVTYYDTIVTVQVIKRTKYDTTFIKKIYKTADPKKKIIKDTTKDGNSGNKKPPMPVAENVEEAAPSSPSLPKATEESLPPDIDTPTKHALSISAKELRFHLEKLASPFYEGRETGKPGQRRAADYIAKAFASYGLPGIGLEGSYLQNVPLISETWEDIGIKVNDKEFEYLEDFYCFVKSNRTRAMTERDEVVFLGYGIDDEEYSDYEGVDVQGKVVLIYQGEPMNKDSVSYLTGTKEYSDWTYKWEKKLEVAKKRGVRTVLFIERNIPFFVSRYSYFLTQPYIRVAAQDPAKGYVNSCYISTKMAKEIIGNKFSKVVAMRDKINSTGKPQALKMKCKIQIRQKENKEKVDGSNVLGYIEGTDPDLKKEHVIVTAHYDHLGKKGDDIYFGADDNASGTSAVLEIAQAFANAKKEGEGPKRSILVMAVSGEEKGLLGSAYYVDQPVLPLENAVANLNVDMIGRIDKFHPNDPNYVYVIGADRLSSELHEINESMNKKYMQLKLDYKYNAKDDPNQFYTRSDHYNFAKKGIPAAFYFNGTHKDYHQPSDTPDKIDYEKMERITRLIFYTAWDLSNRTDRIKVDQPQEGK